MRRVIVYPLLIVVACVVGFTAGAWSEWGRWAQYELLCREALADELETDLMIRNCVQYVARQRGYQ